MDECVCQPGHRAITTSPKRDLQNSIHSSFVAAKRGCCLADTESLSALTPFVTSAQCASRLGCSGGRRSLPFDDLIYVAVCKRGGRLDVRSVQRGGGTSRRTRSLDWVRTSTFDNFHRSLCRRCHIPKSSLVIFRRWLQGAAFGTRRCGLLELFLSSLIASPKFNSILYMK